MSKSIYTNVRMNELLKQKIDTAAQQQNLTTSEFIRQTLEEKSEQILMGKYTPETPPILLEILKRISYIQADLKHDTQRIDKGDPKQYNNVLEKIAAEVTSKYGVLPND